MKNRHILETSLFSFPFRFVWTPSILKRERGPQAIGLVDEYEK